MTSPVMKSQIIENIESKTLNKTNINNYFLTNRSQIIMSYPVMYSTKSTSSFISDQPSYLLDIT